MKSTAKVYFPGLNGLRFFAASMVIFHHVEQYKFWSGMPSAWGNAAVDSLGHQAVSFFFVLSGFLITYLLMVEHQKSGTIHLGKFYWRRILRIWPLYFLIVAIAFFLAPMSKKLGYDIPSELSLAALLSLIFLLPNLLRVMHPTLLGANQLWSVGIEEQFYAVWPVLIRKFIRSIIPFLGAFIFIKLIVHWMLLIGVSANIHPALLKIERIYALFPVEQMAVGGLGAALLFYQYDRIVSFVLNKWLFFITIALLIGSSVSGSHFVLKSYLDAVLFTIILIHVVKRPELHNSLERKSLLHLGNISYGIYMWHTLVITLVIGLVNYLALPINLVSNLIIHMTCFAVSVGVAHFSYKWYETPFLKMKDRFAFDTSSIKRKWASH
ncbi:acyltransferase family protein [Marinoscillum pacificum]|uniref:acyltransferase family protein n=1 Tax=Marinoscillum pacificum TaxID=392723 RepID=UPI002157A8D2|nr:acyltransferase [Marinoscillum pacificum]